MHPINFGIFEGNISFSCGMSMADLKEAYIAQGCHNWAGGLRGITLEGGCQGVAVERKYKGEYLYYLILAKPFTFTDEEIITLAHECLHLVQFRLKYTLDRDREYECEAYLHSYLMKQILKALREHE